MVVTCLMSDRYRRVLRGMAGHWYRADATGRRQAAARRLRHQPEARARFKAEARHAGALSHQNIARVYDYGEPPCGQSCHRCAVVS